MKIINLILLIFGFESLIALPNDTLKVKLKEVEVSAEKIISESFIKFNFHSSITENEIQRFQPWQISEIINNYSGVLIRDYGGLGGLKTVSLRGMNTNQNVVLINGVKINSSQNMIADLSLLSTSFFKNIEIIKGGSAAIYGAGAMGGTINLINNIQENSINMQAEYGSFNQKKIILAYSDNKSKVKSSGNFEYEGSDGNFNFKVEGGKEFTRKNSDFSKLSFFEQLNTNLSGYNLTLILNSTLSKKGVPGPINYNYEDLNYSKSRLNENIVFGILKIDRAISQNSIISFSTNSNIRLTKFRDDEFFGVNGQLSSEYFNNDFSSFLSYLYYGSHINYNMKFEYNYSYLESDNGIQQEIQIYNRKNIGLMSQFEAPVINMEKYSLIGFLGLRYDYFSDIESSPSGFLGTILNFLKLPFGIKTNISYNFRPPSFNELYYFNFGNVNLKPEKSLSYNLGINYYKNDLQFELNGFYTFTNDQIIAIPQNPVYWSAKNIQKVQLKGFEINLEYNLNKNINLNYNLTYSKALDKTTTSINYNQILAYTPVIISNFMLFYNDNYLNIGFTLNYTGDSYYLPDNKEEFKIPDYLILNFFSGYKIKIFDKEISFNFNIRNLTNENYYIIKSYPMPGINFRGGFNVKL